MIGLIVGADLLVVALAIHTGQSVESAIFYVGLGSAFGGLIEMLAKR